MQLTPHACRHAWGSAGVWWIQVLFTKQLRRCHMPASMLLVARLLSVCEGAALNAVCEQVTRLNLCASKLVSKSIAVETFSPCVNVSNIPVNLVMATCRFRFSHRLQCAHLLDSKQIKALAPLSLSPCPCDRSRSLARSSLCSRHPHVMRHGLITTRHLGKSTSSARTESFLLLPTAFTSCARRRRNPLG
jgi:hypothetical protein